MTTQRINPALRTTPIGVGDQPVARRLHALSPAGDMTPAEQLDALSDDYHRALFCRSQAELYRHQWFTGRQREIDHVRQLARLGDARFKTMTSDQLELTAKLRWSQATQAKRLNGLEEKFSAWALMYLSFAEFELRERYASSLSPE